MATTPMLELPTDLADQPTGRRVSGVVLVTRCEVGRDRNGFNYLRLCLRCVDGAQLDARWWRYPYPVDRLPQEGQVCEMVALVDRFNERLQLRLLDLRPTEKLTLDAFVRTTRTPVSAMTDELDQIIASLSPETAQLVKAVLTGEVFERFCTWPAAHTRHGAVRHGLLSHSLRVARIAVALAELELDKAASACDRDLVVSASLLHDVGKVYTLPSLPGGAIPEESRLADHVTRGVALVLTAAESIQPGPSPNVLQQLTHILLAHHGQRRWGSPVVPRTVEAWLVHLADYCESHLWQWTGEEPESGATPESATSTPPS